MTTFARTAEFSKINPEFYNKLTYTQILFFVTGALGHVRFFFDNTSEKELIIALEDLEQIDPNRRVVWDQVSADEKEQVIRMLAGRLVAEGFPTKLTKDGLVAIERSSAKRARVPSAQRIKNNRDVPLIRRLLRF